MQYCLIIGKPPPALQAAIPVFEAKGLLKCLGVIEEMKKDLEEVLEFTPKIIFINLDFPEPELMKIMEKLKQLLEIPPHYIGITDSFENGFKAFKMGFMEVLLSPQNYNEIINAILNNISFKDPDTEVIYFNSFRDEYYLKPAEILYLKADNFTTDIYLTNGKIIGILRTLKAFEALLPSQFIRIQKSIIINSCYLYHVNNAKKHCRILGAPTHFKYSERFIPNNMVLKRWE